MIFSLFCNIISNNELLIQFLYQNEIYYEFSHVNFKKTSIC